MTTDELLHLTTGDHIRFINDPKSDYVIISRYSERKSDGVLQDYFSVIPADIINGPSIPYTMQIKSDDMISKWEVIKSDADQ